MKRKFTFSSKIFAEIAWVFKKNKKREIIGKADGKTAYITAPDEEIVRKAKEDAKILFPNDEAAQKDYWITKGAATMATGIIGED